MSYWDEITARLAALSGVATPQVARQQLREFDVRDIEAVRVSEGGGGGGGLPSGGSTGEVLTKESNADGDVGWEAGGGSQPLRMVTVTFAYNTPNILTGIPFFVPAVGEVFGNNLGYLIPDPVFDGTTPTVDVFRQGDDPDAEFFAQEPLTGPTASAASLLGIQTANIGPGGFGGFYGAYQFPDATPVLIRVSDGSGGDPNDPTPMSQGEATLVLFMQAAS